MFVKKRPVDRKPIVLSIQAKAFLGASILLVISLIARGLLDQPPNNGFKSFQALYFVQSDKSIEVVELFEIDSSTSRFTQNLVRWYPQSIVLQGHKITIPLTYTFASVRFSTHQSDGSKVIREIRPQVKQEGGYYQANISGPELAGFPAGITEVRMEYRVVGLIHSTEHGDRLIANLTGNPFAGTSSVRVEVFPPLSAAITRVRATAVIQEIVKASDGSTVAEAVKPVEPQITPHPEKRTISGQGAAWVVFDPQHMFLGQQALIAEVSW